MTDVSWQPDTPTSSRNASRPQSASHQRPGSANRNNTSSSARNTSARNNNNNNNSNINTNNNNSNNNDNTDETAGDPFFVVGADERSPQRAGNQSSSSTAGGGAAAAGAAANDPNTETSANQNEKIVDHWRDKYSAAFRLQRECATESMYASARRRRKQQQQRRTRSEIAAAQGLRRILKPAAEHMLNERQQREESKQKKHFWENRVALLRREVERERHVRDRLVRVERERAAKEAQEEEEKKWEAFHRSLYSKRTRLTDESAISAEVTAHSGGQIRNPHHEQMRLRHLQVLRESADSSFQQKRREWEAQRDAEARRRDDAERRRRDAEKERQLRVKISRAVDRESQQKRAQAQQQRVRESKQQYDERIAAEAARRRELDEETHNAIQQSHELVEQIRKLRRSRIRMETEIMSGRGLGASSSAGSPASPDVTPIPRATTPGVAPGGGAAAASSVSYGATTPPP